MSNQRASAFYAVLGVSTRASTDEIELAWRRLARKFHPDTSTETNALEQFQMISWAYAEVGRAAIGRNKYPKSFRVQARLGSFRPQGWDQEVRERLQAEWAKELASRPEPARHWWSRSSRHS